MSSKKIFTPEVLSSIPGMPYEAIRNLLIAVILLALSVIGLLVMAIHRLH